jgi:hypothetical protein
MLVGVVALVALVLGARGAFPGATAHAQGDVSGSAVCVSALAGDIPYDAVSGSVDAAGALTLGGSGEIAAFGVTLDLTMTGDLSADASSVSGDYEIDAGAFGITTGTFEGTGGDGTDLTGEWDIVLTFVEGPATSGAPGDETPCTFTLTQAAAADGDGAPAAAPSTGGAPPTGDGGLPWLPLILAGAVLASLGAASTLAIVRRTAR